MPLKGRDGGTWKDASAVYGRSGGNWLYAKSVWGNKNGTWTKGWTDCRKHDEGGRDWSASAPVTEYQGSCTTRESRTRTDYTKDGCTGYSRYTSWVADPTCAGACTTANTGNFSSGGIDYFYSGPAGYYEAFLDGDGPTGGCQDCPTGQFNYGFYYVTTCGGVRTIALLSCEGCLPYV